MTETNTIKTSNMVYVNKKTFNNYDITYIVEEVTKTAVTDNIFENNQFSHFSKILVKYPFTTCKMK